MDIKILIAAHKQYWMPDDPVYLPLHVGAEGKQDLGYTKDNTGDNISAKNPNFCELTGLYWAWKNLDADYIGLVHYRRYFTRKEVHNIEKKKTQILTGKDWESILSKYPVVVPDKRNYYIETNRSHYNHAHHSEGLDLAEQIIKEKYPDYLPAFTTVMNRTWAHMFNMFLMRRDLFNRYMSWLFDILFEVKSKFVCKFLQALKSLGCSHVNLADCHSLQLGRDITFHHFFVALVRKDSLACLSLFVQLHQR